jgi:hypothetical protein
MNDIKELIQRIKGLRKYKLVITVPYEDSHMVLNALEKQIPKKTTIFTNKDDVKIGKFTFKAGCNIHKCPVCESNIAYGNYCYNCGQLLERRQE